MMGMRTNWDVEDGEPMSKWVQIHVVTFNKYKKRLIIEWSHSNKINVIPF